MSLHIVENVTPDHYWREHATAWANIADAEYEYVGDVAAEDFYHDLWDAAYWVRNTYFRNWN